MLDPFEIIHCGHSTRAVRSRLEFEVLKSLMASFIPQVALGLRPEMSPEKVNDTLDRLPTYAWQMAKALVRTEYPELYAEWVDRPSPPAPAPEAQDAPYEYGVSK